MMVAAYIRNWNKSSEYKITPTEHGYNQYTPVHAICCESAAPPSPFTINSFIHIKVTDSDMNNHGPTTPTTTRESAVHQTTTIPETYL